MPNGVHNTRIEDDRSGTELADFVRQGAGADTINRYLESSDIVAGTSR